ncbi:hypothetical protein VE02_09836 [Pseudogymnoascus sp. 03VT05]|nr:hypothetical protein VE02_09836 [Pseudogymnoascus sp. 03VT05]
MDTTIPNPGGISDLDIAALETWSPQDWRLDRPLASLSGLGQSMGFGDLASELQLLKQKIYKESQTLKDFSKIADDAHAKVEVASAMKGCKTKGSKSETVGVKGLDRLSFSNVGSSHPYRYWAHLVSAIFVAISVCLILQAELRSYSRFEESLGAQSTGSSILLVSSSKKPLALESIRRHFGTVFGGVQGITINRDFRLLDAKISRLDAWIAKLEAAETELVRKASRSKEMPTQPLLAQHSFVLL